MLIVAICALAFLLALVFAGPRRTYAEEYQLRTGRSLELDMRERDE